MRQYLIVDPYAYKDLDGNYKEMLTWSPKPETAMKLASADEANKWKAKVSDATGTIQIDGGWAVVKDAGS